MLLALVYLLAGIGLVVLLWYLVAMAWAASVAKHEPELRDQMVQVRFGWRCPRCGRLEAPSCRVRVGAAAEGRAPEPGRAPVGKVSKCGGPLVWVQRATRIKCARCHRYFIAQPMLFRQTPRPGRRRCHQCGWSGVVKDWKVS